MLFWKPFNIAIPNISHAVRLYNITIKGLEEEFCYTSNDNSHTLTAE